MKKYYKLLIILLIVSFVIPQIALASWWNPFSWKIWSNIQNVFSIFDKSQTLKETINADEINSEDEGGKQQLEEKTEIVESISEKIVDSTQQKLIEQQKSDKSKADAEKLRLIEENKKLKEEQQKQEAQKQETLRVAEENRIRAEQEVQSQQKLQNNISTSVPTSTPTAPQDNSVELKKEAILSLQKEVDERARQRKQDINKIIEIYNKYSDFSTQRFAEADQESKSLKAEYIAKGAYWLDSTGPMEVLTGSRESLNNKYWREYDLITNRLKKDIADQRVILDKDIRENWPDWASSSPNVISPPKIELFKQTEKYIQINTPNGSSNWEITPNGGGGYYMQSYSFGKSMLFNVTSMGNGEYYVNNY